MGKQVQEGIDNKENKKENINKNNFKKITLKGVTLATALSIILSSTAPAFAGEYHVDNWDGFKEAIIQDILKQDDSIKIYYEGEDKPITQEEASSLLSKILVEAFEDGRLQGYKGGNFSDSSYEANGSENPDGSFNFTFGQYSINYISSSEEMEEVQEIVDDVLSEIIDDDMTDYEKVRAVYEYTLDTLYYKEHDDDTERKIIAGLNGEGVVCDGYSLLMSKLLTDMGFKNIIISGEVGGRHSWNLVELEGNWYHIDATWGDRDEDEIFRELKEKLDGILSDEELRRLSKEEVKDAKEEYFLISDEVISTKSNDEERTWNRNKYPSAPYSYNEFNEKSDFEKAKIAVEEAESSKDISDIEKAKVLVESLEDGQEKEGLQKRLEELELGAKKEEIEIEIDRLLEKAQGTDDKEDLEEIEANLEELKIQIQELRGGEVKEQLLGKVNEAEKVIGNKIVEIENNGNLEEAIKLVEKVEETKLQEDIDKARELVNQLPDSEEKKNLIARLDAVQNEVDEKIALEETIKNIEEQINSLVDKGEIGLVQEKINLLPEGNERDRLQNILDNKTVELETVELDKIIQEVISAVEQAKNTKTQEDIDIARSLISQLPEGNEKEELNNNLDIVQNEIDEKTVLEETIKNIEEQINNLVDKEKASSIQENIHQLPGGSEKDRLQSMLDNKVVELEEKPADEEDEDPEKEPTDEEDEDPEEKPADEEDEDPEKEPTDEEDEDPEEKPVDEEDEDPEKEPTDEEDEDQEEEPVDEEDEDPEEKPADKEDGDPEEKPADKEDGDPEEKPADKEDGDPEEPTDEKDKGKEDSKPIIDNTIADTEAINGPVAPVKPTKPIEKQEKTEEEIKKEKKEDRLKINKEKIEEVKTILNVIPDINTKIMVKEKEINPDVKPHIYKEKEEKVLVPIRFVAEALGFEVGWSKPTWDKGIKKVFLSYKDNGIILEINKDLAYVNGEPVIMDFAPKLKDGRTYVSLEFISQVFDIVFDYENQGGNMILKIK